MKSRCLVAPRNEGFSFLIAIVVMVFLLVPAPACGEKKEWSDVAELSYVDTSGNTEVRTLSVKNTLKYGFIKSLLGTWKLGILYREAKNITLAERYTTELRLDYKFRERFSLFGNTGWLKDRFSGIDLQYYLGAGMGYQVLTGPTHFLVTEPGVNYTTEEHTNKTETTYLAARFFIRYDYLFSKESVQ